MSKQNVIKVTGNVIESLSNSLFKVVLENGCEIICHISGKIRINNIRIMPGDKVEIAMSPYDLTKGRIETRLKSIVSDLN